MSTELCLLQVHPDLFAQHPEQQECNDASFQRLMVREGRCCSVPFSHITHLLDSSLLEQGFFDSIKKNSEAYPPAQTLQLPFYVREQGGDGFRKLSLRLDLNGGDCAGTVESDLGAFFEELGLESEFDWGVYTWGVGTAAERAKGGGESTE